MAACLVIHRRKVLGRRRRLAEPLEPEIKNVNCVLGALNRRKATCEKVPVYEINLFCFNSMLLGLLSSCNISNSCCATWPVRGSALAKTAASFRPNTCTEVLKRAACKTSSLNLDLQPLTIRSVSAGRNIVKYLSGSVATINDDICAGCV